MPKIWADTIETHRQQVHDAILEATAQLIAERGPTSVGMSAIAERAGVGRATLYKYFPDVDAVLLAWHHRDRAQDHARLADLAADESTSLADLAELVRAQRRRLRLHAHSATIGHLASMVAEASSRQAGGAADRHAHGVIDALMTNLASLLERLAARGEVRGDQPPDVLATWLLHATHAPSLLDDEAVTDLITASLRPASTPTPPAARGPSRSRRRHA